MQIPDLSSPTRQTVRIAYCYQCETLTVVEPYEGPPEYDVHLQHWIDAHLHGKTPDDARGMLFVKEPSQFDHSGAGSAIEEQAIEEVRAELRKANLEVYALRDNVKEDAVKCHQRHGQPHWPHKLCGDYKDDSKRLGRTDVPPRFQQYQCTYCPYEVTVETEKRWRAGGYK